MCIAYVKPTDLPSSETNKTCSTPGDNYTSRHNNTESRNRNSTLTQSAVKAPKRVRFCVEPTVVCTVEPCSSMTEEERSQVHWQPRDYDYFRGTARIIASEVLKFSASQPPSAHSYDAVLTRVHQVCATDHTLQFSPEEKQDATIAAFADDDVCLPPNLFAALTHWAKAGHSRRGLEKFCVPHHMQTRPLQRQAVVQAVLISQDLLAETRNAVSNSGSKKDEGEFHVGTWTFPLSLPDHEILRMVSQRFTKASAKLAVAMGHADAAAVGNYDHTNV